LALFEFQGYIFPFEWVIGIILAFSVLLILTVLMLVLYMRKGDSGPQDEDIAALVSVDEHDTIQEGPLIGGVERTEDELWLKNPEWNEKDEDSQSGTIVDITQKVPLPLRDASGRRKRLWILRDKGHIDCVSASTLVSEKIPKRWDLPLIDWRRVFRHLEGPRTGNSISNLLSTKMGILTVLGVGGFFSFMTFFFVTVSGHLK
jgi:hypothetical protein